MPAWFAGVLIAAFVLLLPASFSIPPARAATTFIVNSNADGVDASAGDGVCQTATVGQCTLRAAIQEANALAGTDTINFNITGCPGGICTISPASELPHVTQAATIDATTQPGWAAGAPVVELNGTGAAGSAQGLWLAAPTTVKGLVINRFNNGSGILLAGGGTDAGGSVLTGNFIGTNVAGTADLGNAFVGISLQTSTPVTMGGSTLADRNVISGNGGHGIEISNTADGHNVWGNYIGTNKNGTAALPNDGSGIRVLGRSNINIGGTTGVTVGGSCTGYCNLISGNAGNGVVLDGATGLNEAHAHVLKGNYIGTDVTGTLDLGNTENGVLIQTIAPVGVSIDHIIGGSTAEERNLISGNGASGIATMHTAISSGTMTGILVQGNFIGTNVTGTAALGNSGFGVHLSGGASSNTIGGTAAGAGNTIAFNTSDGVLIFGAGATGNGIRGNSIHDNAGLGINNEGGGNTELTPPVITSVGSAAGTTTCGGCTIDVYSDNADEGKIYEGSVVAANSGGPNFAWSFAGPVDGPNITATVTNGGSNTSEFSAPASLVDTDKDGITDKADNCPLVPNADQTNTDGDQFGNACDSDDDNDGYTDAQELALNPPENPLSYCAVMRADVNGDGSVTIGDLAAVASQFLQTVPPANPRYDQGLTPRDDVITIGDLAAMAAQFLQPVGACL